METLFNIDTILAFQLFDAHAFFDWFYHNASYLFVFIFMIIESSFIPFPSELVVPPAAYIAANRGDLNIFLVVLVATGGALTGALVNYYLSLWLGRPIVYSFADSRLGRACMVTPEKVKRAEDYFDRHGSFSTFIGRLIPVIRQFISIPAGLARMNIGKFIIFTTLGALLWNIILGGLGYWLGKTVQYPDLESKISEYNTYLSWGGFAILMAVVAVIVYNAARKKNAKHHSEYSKSK